MAIFIDLFQCYMVYLLSKNFRVTNVTAVNEVTQEIRRMRSDESLCYRANIPMFKSQRRKTSK